MSTPTVVLVPGACHGAWWYASAVDALTAAGHRALAVTLPGLCERADELDGSTNLASHVADLTDRLRDQDGDLVLVGHSYGGMVTAGVADALPGRVVGLCTVDGFTPEDGDSCWSSVNHAMRDWYIRGAARSGVLVDPMPQFDPRATGHPLASLVQRITLTGAHHDVPVKHYALAANPAWTPTSPFPRIAEKLSADPTWTVHDLPTTHNVLADGPDVLVGLVDRVLADVTG
ncbi:alpha/beta hydrolase [Actinomycetospora endophytica]|uniref:Alpha/beta hydrolase n=1 Tax=Actinomycetospora endophytica TaxID=2291215 RepID=A0ABS8P8B6_9PSEU|nr:alpha/beta hydrolase [Actinomycetospora endophytica]MCD2194493.1 alpha/beta hydrolase [Actinomycetospora endophytica]